MSIFMGNRNRVGLSERQVEYCTQAWEVLCGNKKKTLKIEDATKDGSNTRFVERSGVVYLGADAFP
jgi:hypothetical protein